MNRGTPSATGIRQDQPLTDASTPELLSALLRDWHGRAWVSGTGGGICGPTEDGNLFLAPTGVHKELVTPEDFFVVSPTDGTVLREPETPGLRPSECNAIFGLIARERGARSVAHSHALTAVLAADLTAGARRTTRSESGARDELPIANLEMLKGIRGLTNRDVHRVAVIDNTPREPDLVAELRRVLDDPRFTSAHAVLVRDHGAYIWGEDVWEAKRHVEVYHFLFEAMVARHDRAVVTGGSYAAPKEDSR
ncbi:MAG TPA: methylthioribulose 1-phosphate dehydratase [Candidatus Limnocylindrales bacterium]|nr:methylthioribulose 1-phosphate dehydratase [Candidatus Limnocylindrales bacterium]